MKRLRRNTEHGTIAGVIAGLGDYFEVDPVALRVLFILIVLITGVIPGVIAYILAIFIMPSDTQTSTVRDVPPAGDAGRERNAGQSEDSR